MQLAVDPAELFKDQEASNLLQENQKLRAQ